MQNSEVLDVRQILLELHRFPEKLSIAGIHDPRLYTLLHVAAFNNQPKIIDLVLEYEKDVSPKHAIAVWVNQLNNDEFTAFHFAAYRGSIRTLDLLKEQGADMHAVNQQGQNAFQIAAQGDQVLAMVWLKQHGVDMLHRDQKGGTALHWSAFYGSEFSIQFLLSWIKSEQIINIQDQDGMTALHLAAMTGNIRIVKKLLLRGANKTLKDAKDQTPSNLAEEGQYMAIVELFAESNCFLEFLNIKTSFKRL